MCRMESNLTLLRVVRGAEKLRSGYEVVGLQPTSHGSAGRLASRLSWGDPCVRLLGKTASMGALPDYDYGCPTRRWGRLRILQFVACYRDVRSLLIGVVPIRKRTAFDVKH